MLPRTYLNRLQRNLYHKLQSQARISSRDLSPELKRYFLEYQKEFQAFKEVASKRELLLAVLNSQIVYCGDYHSLSQAQKTVIRLLRDAVKFLKRKKRRLILALEMFQSRQNKVIRQYMAGQILEEEFLKKTNFSGNWGFSWENYKELLHFAKDNQIEVVGVNAHHAASLKERDRTASFILADLTESDPDALVFVLMGDMHLASPHLPYDVKKRMKQRKLSRQTLIIHQNNEKYYWSLVNQGLENLVDVVQVKRGVYCVMNTPPWVKLQSHLNSMELVSGAEAIHEIDHSYEIHQMIQSIALFLGLKTKAEMHFQIRGPFDLSFLDFLDEKKAYTRKQFKLLCIYLSHFKSFYFANENIIFLTVPNTNYLAQMASFSLQASISGFQGLFENPKRDFYRFIWVEALGYWGSKVINPKRKCNGKKDLKKIINERASKKPELALRYALNHLENEERYFAKRKWKAFSFNGVVKTKEILEYYKAAKILGHLLGEGLYHALLGNQVTQNELKKLFSCSFESPKTSQALYLEWVFFLQKEGFRDVNKNEKL